MKLPSYAAVTLLLGWTCAASPGNRQERIAGSGGDSAGLYLVELGPGETRWVTEEQKWELKRAGKNFFDITYNPMLGHLNLAAVKPRPKPVFPAGVSHGKVLRPLLEQLSKERMRANLERFSGFRTRYYKSDYGRQSSEWLLAQVEKLLAEFPGVAGATAVPFAHPWGQSSVVATVPGRTNRTVVVGAHQDSINLWAPSLLPAPGADDDGSGTVTILEALRVLLSRLAKTGEQPENTIEFHWYSAEEGGLLGSSAIFSRYEALGRDVRAMLQQDMTGYSRRALEAGKPDSLGVITDFVDPALTEFIKKIITEYCALGYIETKCGYACSDHASASKAGYPSAFVIETAFELSNNHIHTMEDTVDRLSFDHMLQHARLTLALVYELAYAEFEA